MDPQEWQAFPEHYPQVDDVMLPFWRSVRVLCATKDGKVYLGYLEKEFDFAAHDEGREPDVHWCLDGRDAYRLDGVTHWMPLPAAP